MSLYKTFKRMQTGPVMVGVAIFGLVTFTITGAVVTTFQSDARAANSPTITLPSGATRKLTDTDRSLAAAAYTLFFERRRNNIPEALQVAQQARMMDLFRQLLPLLSTSLADREDGGKRDEVLQVMLLAALARDKGIDVGQGEISAWVSDAFTSPQEYTAFCGHFRLSPVQFEAALKEALLVKRTFDIGLAETPLPSGDEIVAEWRKRNERYTFDVAAFSAKERRAALEKTPPTDAELQAHFDALPPMGKERHRLPAQFALDGLAVTAPAEKQADAFEALMAAAEVQEQDARSYYQISRAERFAKPAAESKPAGEGAATQPESAPASVPSFLPFDEVKDRAMRETRVARALEKVSREAQEAAASPGFDLKAFGDKYGLTYFTTGEPRTAADLAKVPVHGTASLGVGLADSKEGAFLSGYRAAPGAIEVARLTRKVDSRIPEIAAIRDALLPEYLDKKAYEKAQEDASAFQKAVLAASGDDKFAAAAKQLGVEIKTLPPVAKSRRDDPDYTAGSGADPAHFLAGLRGMGGAFPGARPDPFELKKGDVSPPIPDENEKVVYVVRVAGRAEPPDSEMGPADYHDAKESIVRDLRLRRCQELLSADALSKTLKLKNPTES